MNKKFDIELFKENDDKARHIVTKQFEAKGYQVVPNPNKYGPDLMLYNSGNQIGFIECEIKKVWNTERFPYANVQFPQRKTKYVKNNSLPIIFFMLNKNCTTALMVKGIDVVSSKLVEVPNKYLESNEMFYQVSLDKVKFIKINVDKQIKNI